MKNPIRIESYAKINLSLDVTGKRENGMHDVDTVMQLFDLADSVEIEAEEAAENEIVLSCSDHRLPTDEGNLAYRAAKLFLELTGKSAKVKIHIEKNIPIEAGLAGGSGNAAAVILGLNHLLNTDIPLEYLMEMGKKLGSDIPFCLMGQAKGNVFLGENLSESKMATFAARGTGTGVDMEVTPALEAYVLLVKPSVGVPTAEVYRGIDECEIPERPNNKNLVKALAGKDLKEVIPNMINVLENYTLKARPDVEEIKRELSEETDALHVLMSGSGPTVFALFDNPESLESAYRHFEKSYPETYLCKTLY